MKNDLPEVKEALKGRVEDLCRKLLPDGKRNGRLWVAHNPVTGDFQQSPEFKVALDRDRGAWKDWRSGETGDVLKLISYIKGLDFKETMDFARDFCGIRTMTAEQRRELDQRTRQAQQAAAIDDEQRRLKRMEKAEKIWNSGYQDGARSAAEAHARRYFAARALPLDEIVNRDFQTFRFAGEQEYWPRAQFRYENGQRRKEKAGPLYPAVLSAMRLATGQIAAVHMTFLSPLGPTKLPVSKDENSKIMFGEAKGAMIRISHGPEGAPPELAREAHPLILCEGVEDGLSLALAIPEARVWAAGSLSAMGGAPVWLPCISGLIIARDNDFKPAAQKQFDKVLEALQAAAPSLPMTTIASHMGKDFNDLIKEDEG